MKKDNVNKFILVGLPRSGTTVIANAINSLEHAFCFLEPHWQYSRHKNIGLFKDDKLKGIYFLKYRSNDTLPLDYAIRRINKRYLIVGFKETFRCNKYSTYDDDLPNEDLLVAYKNAGYKVIGILRDPLNVWNSLKSKTKLNSWANDINYFIYNYCRCYEFFTESPILYELFLCDPVNSLENAGISCPGWSGELCQRKCVMGDQQANASQVIEKQKREILYTTQEKCIIENSKAMDIYKKEMDITAS